MNNDHLEYQIFTFFVNALDFGLAQTRKRFLMIGVLRDVLGNDKFTLEYAGNSPVTLFDVIGHLPPPPDDFIEHSDYPNHIRSKISELSKKRFAFVPPGGGWESIPFHLRLPCHQRMKPSSGWRDVFGRLEWDKPCPTITSGFSTLTKGRFGHPHQHRPLTPREAACLQGFDDQFRFYGTKRDICLQIANAVPPPIAHAVGKEIIRIINK